MTSEMKRAAWRGLEGRLVLPRDERSAATPPRVAELRPEPGTTAPEPPMPSGRSEDEGTAA